MLRQFSRVSTNQTNQRSKVLGREDQVENSEGGFVFKITPWEQLDRFLILGTQAGTFYIGEKELTEKNCQSIVGCITEDGIRVVDRVVEISNSGRAPNNDYALFVLAMCAGLGNDAVRAHALRQVSNGTVIRIGTHMLHFAAFVEQFRSWGRGLKRAVAGWYNQQDVSRVAYQLVKYAQRDGWAQRDMLRLSHARPITKAHDALFRYATHGVAEPIYKVDEFDPDAINEIMNNAGVELNGSWVIKSDISATNGSVGKKWIVEDYVQGKAVQNFAIKPVGGGFGVYPDSRSLNAGELAGIVRTYPDLKLLAGVEKIKQASTAKAAAAVITEFSLPRECVPTQHLKSPEVWEALLYAGNGMPLTALIRNLGNMSKSGFLVKGAFDTIKTIVNKLGDETHLLKSRVHPIAILAALTTYSQGHGMLGKGVWPVVTAVRDALDKAFYLAFGNVTPIGNNVLIGIDVSGSMAGGEVNGIPGLTPRVASAAMCLVTHKVETEAGNNVTIMAFSDNFVPLDISSCDSLSSVIKEVSGFPFQGTDCALPMTWAASQYKKNEQAKYGSFIVYTDNETWAGNIHPFQALRQYRQLTGIHSRLAVVGMASTDFSIADPRDAGMMDFVGFDTAAPELMSSFFRGEL